VVVNDEIRDGILVEYMRLPNVFESFYAITVKRRFESPALGALLDGFKPFRAGAIRDADVQ
ncbi:MAG: LysR family transcriptional regulator, partial [Pseudomonadota bacterium]